jgi:LPXTG-motif cell wall-anchored protein
MQTNPIAIIVVAAAIVLLALGLWVFMRRRRRQHLVELFGPSYDHAVLQFGSEQKAEAELGLREKRFEKAQLRDLSEEERRRYVAQWKSSQERFVESPAAAVAEADFLISEVMRERGYPVTDFEQRLADVAVGHPEMLEHYRNACEIAQRARSGKAVTEDLRQAMIHYRALFDELLGVGEKKLAGTHR